MSPRGLWALSIPLALIGWAGVILFTYAVAPSMLALAGFLLLLGLASALTAAPLVWLVASGLHMPGTGERPALALRAGAWVGVWAATAAGLAYFGFFSWVLHPDPGGGPGAGGIFPAADGAPVTPDAVRHGS